MRGLVMAVIWALVGMAAAGCEQALECGDGTRLEAGMCVLEREPQQALCGFGTVYDETAGQCLPLFPPTTCGEQPSCGKTEEGYYVCSCGDAIGEECP